MSQSHDHMTWEKDVEDFRIIMLYNFQNNQIQLSIDYQSSVYKINTLYWKLY